MLPRPRSPSLLAAPQQKLALSHADILPFILRALEEDFSSAGDITSKALIDPHMRAKAQIIAKQDGVIAGLACAALTFHTLEETAVFTCLTEDGSRVSAGTVISTVEASARTLLGGERTALNFMGRFSGIATLTRKFADEIAHTSALICDTRKTTPGLRLLEKYAVTCGGGTNHRMGLYDAVLIKDNHLALAGSVEFALKRAEAAAGENIEIEIEVDNFEQLKEALQAGARRILLDNMSIEELRACVRETKKRAVLEASGNVTLATVKAIAETGVDLISCGALTHSAPVLDLSLEIKI